MATIDDGDEGAHVLKNARSFVDATFRAAEEVERAARDAEHARRDRKVFHLQPGARGVPLVISWMTGRPIEYEDNVVPFPRKNRRLA